MKKINKEKIEPRYGGSVVCVLCENYYFLQAEPGYSELTPGVDCSMGCKEHHWEFEQWDDTEITLANKMLLAIDCKDFISRIKN